MCLIVIVILFSIRPICNKNRSILQHYNFRLSSNWLLACSFPQRSNLNDKLYAMKTKNFLKTFWNFQFEQVSCISHYFYEQIFLRFASNLQDIHLIKKSPRKIENWKRFHLLQFFASQNSERNLNIYPSYTNDL